MSYDDERLVADVRALLKARKRSARSISQAIDVPYRSMQNYLSGESRMPAVVLVKVLDELGDDIRKLKHGDSLLRHSDLFDAVHKVFGDFLAEIPLDQLGKRAVLPHPRLQTPEMMEAHLAKSRAANELAIRLSEAYDAMMRDQVGASPMPTIKELREMDRHRREADMVDRGEVGQSVGQPAPLGKAAKHPLANKGP